jgi:CRISPR-associated protein Cmr1
VSVTEIEATYRVVTPCFCGGATQQAEFRLPSFKGVLRFWWRALVWSRCGSDRAIHQAEARLFGSASEGQSAVWMRLVQPEISADPAGSALRGYRGARYLSYGMEEAGRECLRAPFDVTVRLFYRSDRAGALSEALGLSLLDALKAVGLFGGVGAKNRKGFGSLVLTSLRVDGGDQWSPPATLAELAERVSGFRAPGDQPGITAWSDGSRQVLVDGGTATPLSLLDAIAWELKEHLRGLEAQGTGRSGQLRAGFGLPRKVGSGERTIKPVARERRASPLLMHIHECNGRSVAVLSLLPAEFLPAGENSLMTVVGSRSGIRPEGEPVAVENATVYQSVNDFLDRLRDSRRRSPTFPAQVWEVPR